MLLDSDRNRIKHIIDAANECLEFSRGCTIERLRDDRPLQHLLVRNLEVIGEASSRMSPELVEKNSQIPWRKMAGMRNRLIHAYYDVDLDIIYGTVQRVLPPLVSALEALLNKERPDL